MSDTVFYSWQSDLPNTTNRGFIQAALEKAAKAIRNDDSVEIEPVIDRDTQGVGGSPDIASTIFDKIEQASIFVCDVSFINPDAREGRLTPNPNILLELGYALKVLGASRIIMVMNTAFGRAEDLPFDLRLKRVLSYRMDDENPDRATERNKLAGMLESGLRTIFEGLQREMPGEVIQPSLAPVTAPRPDVRVVANPGFLTSGSPYDRSMTPTLIVTVENHSPMIVFLGNISLLLKSGERATVMQDFVTSKFQARTELQPGQSHTFHFNPDKLRDRAQDYVCAVVTDAIGREYRSDEDHFPAVLKLSLSPSKTNA